MTGNNSVDIVILTVLPEEYEAVRVGLTDRVTPSLPTPDLYAWEIGKIYSARYQRAYSVAVGMISRPGNVSSALATMDAITDWQPRYVFFVGIAGGFGAKKGDVVVSDMIYGYEYGKVTNVFSPRNGQTFRCDVGLLAQSHKLVISDSTWSDRVRGEYPELDNLKATVGEVASGEKVVDDATNVFFARVVEQWPRLSAIEMEGAGVAAAIEHSVSRGISVKFLMIRGISDLPRVESSGAVRGTPERDLWKIIASKSAAAFAVDLIASGLPDPPNEKPVPGPSIEDRLTILGIQDPKSNSFGATEFTESLAHVQDAIAPLERATRYVLLAALPVDRVSVSSTTALSAATKMLELSNWYNLSGAIEEAPKYWPPRIFQIPTSRHAVADAMIWEDRQYSGEPRFSLSNLAITRSADVLFGSAIRFVGSAVHGIPVFQIGPILAQCWRFSGLVAQLQKDVGYGGSTHLSIAMVNTKGSHLGGFVDPWLEPTNPNMSYWAQAAHNDWSCHATNIRVDRIVQLSDMRLKEQPSFIKNFAEEISLYYSHDTPRCFDRKTGYLPQTYFDRD